VLPEIRTADGLFVVTADQRIVHWSPSAQRILGYAPNDVLGCSCHDVIAGQDIFNARFCHSDCPVVKNARRGRPTDNYDLLVHDQEGTPRWINVTVVVLPGPPSARAGHPASLP
jgi:PAS domain S-box-containing protein